MNRAKLFAAGTFMAAAICMTSPVFAADTADADTTAETTEETSNAAELIESDATETTGYVTASRLRVRDEASTDGEILGRISRGSEVEILGEYSNGWYLISYDESTGCVSGDYITFDEDEVAGYTGVSVDWDGSVLTAFAGVNYGPSGKETYYNLDMSGVVSIMRSMGNTDEYWVRDDGCKMLGDYIMVAADLNAHPRGSLVPTSLGMGIVCDTGGFVSNGSGVALDIATAW